MKKILISVAKAISVFLFWIAVWFLASKRINNDFLFPSPSDTLKALKALVVTSEFWGATLITLCRILYGIILSLLIGCGLAVITTFSAILRALLTPIMNAAKSVPVACFIILAWLWLDTST